MQPTESPPPRKFWKRLRRLVLVAALGVVLIILGLPWLASTSPVRTFVVRQANRALAPTKLEVRSIGFSWFGRQQVNGLEITNQAGKSLVKIDHLSWGRSLTELAATRQVTGELLIEGARLDVERKADGTIDLVDAFSSIMPETTEDPEVLEPGSEIDSAPLELPPVRLKVVNGSIKFQAPELPEPFEARKVNLTAEIPPGKEPLTWKLELAEAGVRRDAGLEFAGELNHHSLSNGVPPLSAKLVAKHWPWGVNAGEVSTRGVLDGTYTVQRASDRWRLTGEGDLLALEASGAALSGDHLKLERMGTHYELTQEGEGWDLKRLDLTSELGSIKSAAKVDANGQPVSTKVHGQLDLAALARQLPHVLRIREGLTVERGIAQLDVELSENDTEKGRKLVAEARIADLAASDQGRMIQIKDPATLSAQVLQLKDDLKVEQLSVKTSFLEATGSGDLDSGVRLSASVDLEGLKTQLHDLIDFGTFDMAGKGRIAAEYRRPDPAHYTGRLAAEFQAIHIAGLTTEPIVRKQLRVDLGATGPLQDAPLPEDWSLAQVIVKTDDLSASTKVTQIEETKAIQIDDLRLNYVPVPTNPPGPTALDPINVAVKGRFEPASGTLELQSLPDAQRPEPVFIGPEGLKVVGLTRGGAIQVTGGLQGDLARIDRAYAWWSGGSIMDVAGAVSLKTGFTLKPDGSVVASTEVKSPDLTMGSAEGGERSAYGPAVIAMHTETTTAFDQIQFPSLAMAVRHASMQAKGELSTRDGRLFAELAGTLQPNWAVIDPMMAEAIEPGAKVRFKPRAFHVRGPLSTEAAGGIIQELEANVAFDNFEAVAFGLQVAPTPVVLKLSKGVGVFDPIQTTINNGPTLLNASLDTDKAGVMRFRLAPGSEIKGAEINDEVSRSLLSYIAPMLHDATRVTGKVTVLVNQADYPLNGDESTHSSLVGRVEFDDVNFAPGKLGSELLAVTGQGASGLKLDQPIELTVADGRVNQKGLSIPVGRDAKLEVEGSVGFDQTIAMRARVPLSQGMLGNSREATELLEGLKVGLPIGGTLSRPTIDRRGVQVGLRDAGREVLRRGANDLLKGQKAQEFLNGDKANQLLDKLTKPGSGNLPRIPGLR